VDPAIATVPFLALAGAQGSPFIAARQLHGATRT
jgi:hypothetical protein